MKTSVVISSVFWATLALAQSSTEDDPKESSTPTGQAALDQEDERTECFLECFRRYGKFNICPYGENQLVACWCMVDDWTEREQDCIWDICSPDAYNNFHLINPRICETVPIPTVSVTNSAYPPASTTTYEEDEDETTTEEAPVSTSSDDDEDEATTEASETSEGATSPRATSATTTAESQSTEETSPATTTSGEAAGATEQPNAGRAIEWSASAAAGLLVGAAYLFQMML